jgi:hypothetical protein
MSYLETIRRLKKDRRERGESVDGTGGAFNLAEISLGIFISASPDEEFDVNFFALGDPGVLMAEVGNLSEKIVPGVVWTEDYQKSPGSISSARRRAGLTSCWTFRASPASSPGTTTPSSSRPWSS